MIRSAMFKYSTDMYGPKSVDMNNIFGDIVSASFTASIFGTLFLLMLCWGSVLILYHQFRKNEEIVEACFVQNISFHAPNEI
jgi:hypothetical protein